MASVVPSKLSDLTAAMSVVKPTMLPGSLLKFPPSSHPATLPPPSDHPTLAHPFTIPTNVYNTLLSPTVPITIALVYASVISYFNTVNAQRKYKPWAFSQTKRFRTLVILHNAILAVYSAWTCLGMINALVLSFPGWRGEYGLAGAIDSLCKINGPRGLGSAATFNETTSAWHMTNPDFRLAADGLAPESTDVGRMWNEGLAFYGWLFYLSKFYEVVDTAIILAKGKKSSFLQTYHHAGAMLCMWAGIRYMSPPIWMFVLVNSGIHAIMYTFYLCTVIRVPVNKKLKRALTTVQIAQFIVGASYAFAHLFIAYKVPVSVPYIYHLGSVASSVASEARSGAASITSSVAVTASADAGAWLKKFALRAAGREALAENVLNDRGQKFGVDAVHVVQDFISREETRFADELQWTNCLDTSGQVFAILLNCMYLAPLTWLFVRFFITAYLRRVERRRSSTSSEKAQAARLSFQDASKGFARTVTDVVGEMHGVAEMESESQPAVDGQKIKKNAEGGKTVAQDKNGEDAEKSEQPKEHSGGGIDPIAILRNKSAERWQNMSSNPSEINKEPATDSTMKAEEGQVDAALEESEKVDDKSSEAPGEILEDKAIAIDPGVGSNNTAGSTGEVSQEVRASVAESGSAVAVKAANATKSVAVAIKDRLGLVEDDADLIRASKSATEDKDDGQSSLEGLDQGDTTSPNGDGTGADEVSGVPSPTTDVQDEEADEVDAEQHTDKNKQEESKLEDEKQSMPSAVEAKQSAEDIGPLAQAAEPSSQNVGPSSEDRVSDTQSIPGIATPPEHDSQRVKPTDIEPATPDKEMARRLLALRKASFEARLMSPRAAPGHQAGHQDDTVDGDSRSSDPSEPSEPGHDDSIEGEAAAPLEESSSEQSAQQIQDGAGNDKFDEIIEKPEDEFEYHPESQTAPQPAKKDRGKSVQDQAAENSEIKEADAGEPTAAIAPESKQEQKEQSPEQSDGTGEDLADRKSDKGVEESREKDRSNTDEEAETEEEVLSPPGEDENGADSEEEAEQMSFIEPEKEDEAEKMSLIELEKEQAGAPDGQPEAKSAETSEAAEATEAKVSETNPIAQSDEQEESSLQSGPRPISETAETTGVIFAESSETKPAAGSDGQEAAEAPEAPSTEISETKPVGQSDEEAASSPPSVDDTKVVEDEKPKVNGESKPENPRDTPEPPLIHIDEEADNVQNQKSTSKLASTKSKTPSLKSRSSQSLKSKSSQSLKSKHEEEEDDKENQAPGSSLKHTEAEEGGDGTAKVRDDTTFAEAVKE